MSWVSRAALTRALAGPDVLCSLQDIFRRYPNQYETIIAQLCDNLESLDEPEAKASMIWIIGEYAERIDNADELLETFLETFPEETSMVSGVGTRQARLAVSSLSSGPLSLSHMHPQHCN
jgi:AP-1 complex subunit beta-1